MAKLLVAAKDLAPGVLKGDIVEVYPDTYGWGSMEGLPDFIQTTITDRTDDQVRNYLENIVRSFDYSIDASNANGVRATISVDQSLSGQLDLLVRQEVKDYILSGAGTDVPIVLHAQTANSLTVNITLPNDETRTPTLQDMKNNINDLFQEVIGYRRYFFQSSSVDSVIASGGEWSGTAAQALNHIVDRFA